MSVAPQAVDPDSLRAALNAVFAAREYRWSEPSNTWMWLITQWQRVLAWLEGLRLAFPVRYYLVLGALTFVLIVAFVHLGWIVWHSLRPGPSVRELAPSPTPARDAAWHAAEARRLGAGGRFGEALSHRFLAAMLDLDARRIVQFHPSKTPAEYTTEARLDEADRLGLSDLVMNLYRHVFGGAPCDAETWRRFDAAATQLELRAATR